MTEKQVGFLFKAATVLSRNDERTTCTQLLRSYYLMRCKEITRGYGLPQKFFSLKTRCSHCCLEWNRNSETKIKQLKLSKRQRRLIRKLSRTKDKTKEDLLYSNNLEQICYFCKHTTVTPVLKPKKERIQKMMTPMDTVFQTKSAITVPVMSNIKLAEHISKPKKTKIPELNVYTKTREVFSIKNKANLLSSIIKEKPKIKNNKRKKDKFAGLCQKAVLASNKIKQEKEKQNKLALFLKPSS